MADTRLAMTDRIAQMQDFKQYKDLHWEGSFDDYLQIVRERPTVTRNAYQRCYDMVIAYGTEEYIDNKKKLIAVQVLQATTPMTADRTPCSASTCRLMRLDERAQEPRAQGYGTREAASSSCTGRSARRRATIARQLKKGIEEYSRSPDGALYTYYWTLPRRHLASLAGKANEVFHSARCTTSRCG